MTDQEIIRLYFARDEQAIRETAERHGEACLQVSMSILHNRSDAEECVNDTYLKAWNTIPPTHPASLRAFLCRIARNLALNRRRDLHRRRRDRDLEVALSELEDCLPMPEEHADELGDLLSDFLRAQDKTDRLLFMGRYWHTLSVKELAQRSNLTEGNVSVRLHRTRERLRAYLKERGYEV